MIENDFLCFNDNGLYCSAGGFYLDPAKPVKQAVISHAHGDHACPGNEAVYCTLPTAAIMKLRLKKNAGREFRTFNFHEPFFLNQVKITFIPAGHILGSAQVLMEYRGVRYVYTGDFKLQEDATCETAEIVKADVLITETTFADPEVKHPDVPAEITKLNTSRHNVLLGAYSLGKSQRLISLINQYCPGRTVLLHHSILPITKIYEDFSYPPGKYEPYNRKLMKSLEQGLVYIVPPLTFECYYRAKGVLRVFASGWKRLQVQNDLELYISDHADWQDILNYIEKAQPSEIWTLHGNGEFLKEHLKNTLPVKILT
ncbi:MBL fold metallo-hydrolase [Pararcticibacter amylolyticus]|uniref:Exonuclease n=1 Tax=Pararcticibacter amylolyticus TaxID=2173175 RepID=A0A2U2PEG4_9SPHI|nr:MBL fold metallo-hydrolase [Pararcticibacter amylolyticus]PWG79776.1 exonuclease [Pararcticibacter amylolyticus]